MNPTHTHLGRRSLLAAGAAAALVPVVSGAGAAHAAGTAATAAAGDPYDTLTGRAAEFLTGGQVDAADADFAAAIARLDTMATDLWTRLDRSADRTALWADLSPVTAPGNFGQSYTRLRTLATAWATPGTSLAGSAEVSAALVAALRLLHDRAYNAAARETGNWWFWEIGSPRALMDCCVLLRSVLPAADLALYLGTVDRFVPNPDRRTNSPSLSETGANRADKCVIVALRGLLGRDSAKVALARDGLSDTRDSGRNSLFTYVTSGDGFYEDGSFVQHGAVAYTGTYGGVLLSGAAGMIALLAGSPWAVTDPKVSVMYEAVHRTFTPVMFDGLMMDALRGRAISRERAADHHDGAAVVSAVLLLAEGAPAAYASSWRATVKGWLGRNRTTPYTATAGVAQLARAKALLADGGVRPADRATGHLVFADMDRVVHRRPRWAYTLSLSSRRIAGYEAGNGENLHGWYTGDGMTYLYSEDDLGQFGDAYWPTVDPYRLPGITVDTRPRTDAGTGAGTSLYRPTNLVAGGAALEDRFGVSAMELISAPGSTLRARKAWVFLDNAVIALGSAITASDGRTVETVVENRNLHAGGVNGLLVDGVEQPRAQDWHRRFDRADWAHLDGVGGYVFPGGTALNALREERTGTWRDINTGADTGGSTTPVTRRYLTLWLDHGTSPAGAGYAYVLLPGASPAATAAWSASRPVRIAANSAAVQAVEVRRDGLTAAHFWEAGSAAGITSDGPASVLVRRRDEGISVAVADPGRSAARVTIGLPFPVTSVVRADDTVTVVPGRSPRITVAVGGSRGHTHHAELI
ncbi:hyaluronate lyase [Streptomyces sp. V4I23]|uniref:polysaccharide lyase 8 family protein n=1 Tax=Streptomyces sp. V4I23 TaxID=3042282 RepID=UPI00278A8FC7|nr:polysaccharide lyase 8 family protein [Streptomyces sp. V4I23]MDQ1006393.1 hyaluronate lyase [Streptomyces sp. V4I23]